MPVTERCGRFAQQLAHTRYMQAEFGGDAAAGKMMDEMHFDNFAIALR